MKYTLSWTDATMVENYSDPRELVKESNDQGIDLSNLEVVGGWYEFGADHVFEAESDEQATEYAKKYDFGGRNVEVFSLTRVDDQGKEEFYWTEENWHAEMGVA